MGANVLKLSNFCLTLNDNAQRQRQWREPKLSAVVVEREHLVPFIERMAGEQ